MNTTRTITEIKCSSLPPGLAAPGSESTKLNRSKSNAGSNSQDLFNTVHEDKEKEEKVSLLERLFPRKSGRKKKVSIFIRIPYDHVMNTKLLFFVIFTRMYHFK